MTKKRDTEVVGSSPKFAEKKNIIYFQKRQKNIIRKILTQTGIVQLTNQPHTAESNNNNNI